MGVKNPVPEGINEYIFNEINSHRNIPDSFHVEDIIQGNLLNFFLSCTSIEERSKFGYKVYKKVLSRHEKNQPFYEVLKYAGKIESGIQVFNPTLRDHLTHSVYVYLLGLALFPPQFREHLTFHEEEMGFQWKLTSLLHDIGSPPSLLFHSINSYLDRLQVDSTFDQIKPNISFRNLATLHQRPNRENNPFTLIEKKLREWNITFDIQREYNKGLKNGKIDHGILGALIVLKIIDDKYFQNNPDHYYNEYEFPENDIGRKGWSRRFFDTDVVNVAASISVHNVINKVNTKVKFMETPTLYLLLLSDVLQEWDRYSPGARISDPFSISIQKEDEKVIVHLHLNSKKIQSIKQTVEKLRIDDERIHVLIK